MIDSTLKELWETKDQIAREHDYDPDRLVESLRRQQGRRVVASTAKPSIGRPTHSADAQSDNRPTANGQ
ncbi:hypothetical protein G3480_06145 [Thiorhodococcus mannitoliphagus]|uniref:Uncharacterized protein n=1 Tax=Thiorhodococcus mannitoliphagus TaxID=329406 RepID=A0A6P1DPQ5_9GAMM|nr:hypothetical protein [Thiorhodococcus mannitoliphagus]NEX19899.1 hypothetical protein [Thiorhodococcus mannitoliphagus]